MNKDLTEVVVVLDRSGSMQSCRKETEQGLNSFVEEQKAVPGEVNFSLYAFNQNVTKAHYREPIRNIREISFHPEGYTALHDAIGTAIAEIGASLANTPEHQRPSMVTFMILTDGMENRSTEYKAAQIKEMIERQKNIYNWKFTFFGANQDAVVKGAEIGLDNNNSVEYTTGKIDGVFRSYSGKMSAARVTCDSLNLNYTDTEKADLK